jgi:hypothetical protein
MWPPRWVVRLVLGLNLALILWLIVTGHRPAYSLVAVLMLAGLLLVHPDTRGKQCLWSSWPRPSTRGAPA